MNYFFMRKIKLRVTKKQIVSTLLNFIMLLSATLQFATTSAKADTIKVADKNKIWTITFSQPISIASDIKNNIVIKDSKNKIANVTFTQKEANKVQVLPPPEGYIEGETYILTVGTGIKSTKGKNIKSGKTLTFKIKPQSDVPLVTIKSIQDLVVTIKQNDKYVLPATIEAEMSDNSKKQVNVKWSGSVDTSMEGKFTYYGTVDGYLGKVTLTLTIAKIQSDDLPMHVYVVNYNTSLEISRVEVTLMTYSPEDYNVYIKGKLAKYNSSTDHYYYDFYGDLQEEDVEITIIKKSEDTIKLTIASINNLSVTINQNDPYSLPATVTAVMSDNSIQQVKVYWNNSYVDTSKSETYNFEGTVPGYKETVRLTLNIRPSKAEMIQYILDKIQEIKNNYKVYEFDYREYEKESSKLQNEILNSEKMLNSLFMDDSLPAMIQKNELKKKIEAKEKELKELRDSWGAKARILNYEDMLKELINP